tara:strand:+ start:3369 stop:4151 length:783 start_codon:yes stop_codon:yes gene_type:complete
MFKIKVVLLCLCVSLAASCIATNVDCVVAGTTPIEAVEDPLVKMLGLEEYYHIPESCPLMGATCLVKSVCGSYTGSGVFIEKDAILTAAHIANVCVGGTVMTDFGEKGYRIVDVWTPSKKNFFEANSREGDIAILQLECEVEGVEVLDMLFELGDSCPVSQYDNVFIAGCSVGYKKQSKEGTFLYYGVLQDSPDSLKIWSSKSMVWYGDSGGPVTVKIGDVFYVVGITSGFDLIQESVVDTTACNVRYYKTEIEKYLNSF